MLMVYLSVSKITQKWWTRSDFYEIIYESLVLGNYTLTAGSYPYHIPDSGSG